MRRPMGLHVVVRRVVAAPPEKVFQAWTDAAQLRAWWGPKGVRCSHAESDARVGGRYSIENELDDGQRIVISGRFLAVNPPHELTFTWSTAPEPNGAEERVTVFFEPCERGTEVIVMHEQITDERGRDEHRAGWNGCLEGLAAWRMREAAAGNLDQDHGSVGLNTGSTASSDSH